MQPQAVGIDPKPVPLPGTMRFCRNLLATFFFIVLSACAPMVVSTPVTLAPHTGAAAAFQLKTGVRFSLPTGYARYLPAGSRWQAVGHLPQGIVYRPLNTVFTIKGRQAHEAQLVIDKARLVGFYLPAESRYSSLDVPIQLPLEEPQ